MFSKLVHRFVLAAVLAGLLFAGLFVAEPAAALERIVLVRHAEKAVPWPPALSTYQSLSPAGEARAAALAGLLAGEQDEQGLAAVLASPTARTVYTGLPTARALGVELLVERRTIDPGSFGELFDDLRSRHAGDRGLLIVGHSNTIPALLRHLGAGDECAADLGITGQGAGELIEGYAGLWIIDLHRPGCAGMERREQPPVPAATVSTGTVPAAENGDAAGETKGAAMDGDAEAIAEETVPEPRPIVLDPAHLAAAERTYSVLYGRQPMGLAHHHLERDGDRLTLRQVLDLPRPQIKRETTTVLGAGLGLERVAVTGPMGPSTADVDVAFDGQRLAGHSDFPRSRHKPKGRLAIDRPAPAGVLPAAALPDLLPAAAIDRVGQFSLVAYRPSDDQLEVLDVWVRGQKEVRVPAGTFEAYEVDVLGGDNEWKLWISTDSPRRLLKSEMVGQGWVYELTTGE